MEKIVKKIIDLSDGAKILGKDEESAQEMLEYLVDTLTEVRDQLNNSHHEYQSNNGSIKFSFVVEKFYEGLLYVGAPALRQSVCDLLMALNKKEEREVAQLYQHVLDDMDALEQKVSEIKITEGA